MSSRRPTTRLSPESRSPHRSGREPGSVHRVVAAHCGDTVHTRVFDIAQRSSWPPHYGGRALANAFSETWHGKEPALAERVRASDEITTDMIAARRNGRFDTGPIYAGEGAAQIERVEPAAAILDDLARYREQLHNVRHGVWVG